MTCGWIFSDGWSAHDVCSCCLQPHLAVFVCQFYILFKLVTLQIHYSTVLQVSLVSPLGVDAGSNTDSSVFGGNQYIFRGSRHSIPCVSAASAKVEFTFKTFELPDCGKAQPRARGIFRQVLKILGRLIWIRPRLTVSGSSANLVFWMQCE